MTSESLVAMACEGNWNPYFLAYALETGAAHPREAWQRDGSGAAFMCWNRQRWVETCARIGAPLVGCGQHRAAHLETLAGRLPSVQLTLGLEPRYDR